MLKRSPGDTFLRMGSVADRLAAYSSSRRPPGVVSAYLLGSHARGAPHADSDVDVDVGVVLGRRQAEDAAVRESLALDLTADLVAATHCNAVDVVILNGASPELRFLAITEGRRVYLADAEADHRFVRTVLLRHADLRPFLERTRRTKLAALSQ